LTRWLDKRPDDRAARLLYSELLIDAKQTDKAIAESERLLAADPKNPVVLNNLAWLYSTKGDGRAAGLAEQAYAIAPNSSTIADTLGWLVLKGGDTERALKLLQQATATAPKPAARYHLAVAPQASRDRMPMRCGC